MLDRARAAARRRRRGRDLAADLGGGRAVGAATVLVRSGKGDRPQPGAEAEPDAVIDSVAGLPGLLQG